MDIEFSNYLDLNCINFYSHSSRDKLIEALVSSLYKNKYIEDEKHFFDAILDREKIVSTGIGMGVAIPHAKLSNLSNFFIAIGILPNSSIDWNSIDNSPVRLVFMIGGPDNKQKEYLQILSQLTKIIKDVEIRKKLISSASAQEIYDLLSQKQN